MADGEITKEEIEEALALLNGESSVTIEPARKRVVRHDGRMIEVEEAAYVKFSTNFKKELADLGEHALKVFLYIGLSIGFETGSSHPGIRKIAEDTGMDKDTVSRAVAELEEKKFLEVNRRQGDSNVYTPIRYISIGRTVPTEGTPKEELSPHTDILSPSDAELSPRGRVDLHNQINKKELKDLSLTGEEVEQANHKVDAMLSFAKKGLGIWKGRENFNDNVLHYADWYFSKTGQIPLKNKKAWIKAFSDWKDYGLEIEDLEQARLSRLEWKPTITDPNELTKDAYAIRAQKNIVTDNSSQPTGAGFYA